MTTDMKAIRRLAERIDKKPEQVNNSSLPAGSPIYFYCKLCGHLADQLPENYTTTPHKYCDPCRDLKAVSNLTDTTLTEMANEQL